MRTRAADLKNRLKARLYSSGPGQIYAPAYERIAEALSPEEAPFLDLGCGSGGLVAALADRFPDCRVVGIDRNPAAAGDATRRVNGRGLGEVLSMDGQDMKFDEESFQTVFALQNLMHWKEPDEVLREVLRVLKPGGELRIYQAGEGAIPSGWLNRPWGWPPDAVLQLRWKRYQPTESFLRGLSRRLTGVGFERVERSHEGFYRKWVAVK